jgi:NAD+ diphosphatase
MNAPGFVGGWFDRADRLRISGEADGALQGRMDARLLLLNGLDPQFDARGELNWGPLFDAPEGAGLLFLGLDEAERPCYCALADLPRGVAPLNRHLWPGLTALPPDQASLYATARSLVDWHNRHRFCAVCGSETQVVKAGWSRH